MTLYYDSEKATRSGVTDDWSPETGTEDMGLWTTYYITKVVLDESMKSAKPTSTYYWFGCLSEVKTIENLRYLNTEDVTTMNRMFGGCKSLTSLDLSGFNTENVTDMSHMFGNTDWGDYGCESLTSLDLSNFSTKKVTNMTRMFHGCSKLKSLDLNSFSINSASTQSMFEGCYSLTTIYCENEWKTTAYSKDMFYNCKALKGGKGTVYSDANANDITFAHPDGGTSNPGYFTDNTLASYTVTFKDDISGWNEKQEVEEGSDAIAPLHLKTNVTTSLNGIRTLPISIATLSLQPFMKRRHTMLPSTMPMVLPSL